MSTDRVIQVGQRVRLCHPLYGVSSDGYIESIRDDAQAIEDYGEPLVGLHITVWVGRRRWTDLHYLLLSDVEERIRNPQREGARA
jgi:hypothetical protein